MSTSTSTSIGPWYEESLMTIAGVHKELLKSLKSKYPAVQQTDIMRAIKAVVPEDMELCSFRGYYTFQHGTFMVNVQKYLEDNDCL